MHRFTKRLLEVATVVVGLTLAVFATDAHAATCTVKNPPPSGANNFATIQAAIATPSCTTIMRGILTGQERPGVPRSASMASAPRPAWYDERSRGPDSTYTNPARCPAARSWSNSSGW